MMGGRDRQREQQTDRETWITEVSDKRLKTYERLMNTPSGLYRTDGTARIEGGTYFHDLVKKEIARRSL